jgi:hypothetical protein
MERGGTYRVLVGSPRERDNFDVLGVNGRIILQWIFKVWNVGMDLLDLSQDSDT